MLKATHKTKQPNIKPINKAKNESSKDIRLVDEYRHYFTRKMTPMTQAGLDRFVEGFVSWAFKDETALRPADYPISMGISEATYYRWQEMFPIIAEAHKDVMSVLASRRERGALNRTLSESAVYRRQHQYEKSAEDAARFHASLKAEADNESRANVQFIAVPIGIPDFPSSSLVPERKNELKANS